MPTEIINNTDERIVKYSRDGEVFPPEKPNAPSVETIWTLRGDCFVVSGEFKKKSAPPDSENLPCVDNAIYAIKRVSLSGEGW